MRWVSCIADAAHDGARVYDVLRGQLGASDGSVRRAKRVPRGLLLEGDPARANATVRAGQRVSLAIDAPGLPGSASALAPQPGPLHLVYADADVLVANKPAGLVMYPCPGHGDGTLANRLAAWLAAGGGEASSLADGAGGEASAPSAPSPVPSTLDPAPPAPAALAGGQGLHAVHRLDAGTSGLVAFARNSFAKERLQAQLHSSFAREYLAVCQGVPEEECGQINAPIGLLSRQPNVYGVISDGKPSITHYRVLESCYSPETGRLSLLRLRLETGRTHQIRIHLAYRGCPLVGDAAYGTASPRIARPALHSWRMAFRHPVSGANVRLQAEPPADMRALLPASVFASAQEDGEGGGR